MIINNFVKLKINKQNIKKINKLLNSSYDAGNIIDFPIEKLSKNNNKHKFMSMCDVCGHIKETTMRLYNIIMDINIHAENVLLLK